MSLLDTLRPKWKHHDPAIREPAVRKLERQDVLETIVNDDPSEPVRLAAITRITNQNMLARFACRNDAIALPAIKQLTDRTLLADVALRSASREVREFAVDVLDDRVVLHRIAHSDTDPRVRLRARKKHAGRDATREVIHDELARLTVAQPPERTPEFCGPLDEVCFALVSDTRFRISGSVDTRVPGQATVRELDSGTAPATVARLLAMKRGTETDPASKAEARAYYEIAVWRTAENTFNYCAEEKRPTMVLNPVLWSSVSNETAARSPA